MTEFSIRGSKAIKSVKELPRIQDGPPEGGFPAVRYARRIPNTGPSGAALFLAATGLIAFGFYRVGQGNIQRRGLKQEKLEARINILPLLQAEEDLRFVEAQKKQLEEESHIMRNVSGWVPGQSVYHSSRWMPPATGKLGIEL